MHINHSQRWWTVHSGARQPSQVKSLKWGRIGFMATDAPHCASIITFLPSLKMHLDFAHYWFSPWDSICSFSLSLFQEAEKSSELYFSSFCECVLCGPERLESVAVSFSFLSFNLLSPPARSNWPICDCDVRLCTAVYGCVAAFIRQTNATNACSTTVLLLLLLYTLIAEKSSAGKRTFLLTLVMSNVSSAN